MAYTPLDLGVDISIQALTKYVVGHADALGGAVLTKAENDANRVNATSADWGISLGPDDAYLALRGLRTLDTRWRAHERAGLEIANWMSTHKAVSRVIHPALSNHPDHALWQRDFTGSNGLFGAVLAPMSDEAYNAFFSALTLYGFGFSWGSFESLLIPADPGARRDKNHWLNHEDGHLVRVHIGLEGTEDLIADLDNARCKRDALPTELIALSEGFFTSNAGPIQVKKQRDYVKSTLLLANTKVKRFRASDAALKLQH